MFEVKMLIWKFSELRKRTNAIILIYDLSYKAKRKGNYNCFITQSQHIADV